MQAIGLKVRGFSTRYEKLGLRYLVNLIVRNPAYLVANAKPELLEATNYANGATLTLLIDKNGEEREYTLVIVQSEYLQIIDEQSPELCTWETANGGYDWIDVRTGESRNQAKPSLDTDDLFEILATIVAATNLTGA
jgi:hypothetical protein